VRVSVLEPDDPLLFMIICLAKRELDYYYNTESFSHLNCSRLFPSARLGVVAIHEACPSYFKNILELASELVNQI
jgi:hypothetical protein